MSQPLSPSRSSTTSSLRRHTSYRTSYNGSDNGSTPMMEPSNSRPSSALSTSVAAGNKAGCWMDEKTKRPHTISSAFEKDGSMHQRPAINGHTFMPTTLSSSQSNTFQENNNQALHQ